MEEELPILTKPAQQTDPNKTDDGLPILKKKDVSGSSGLGGTDFISQQRQQFQQESTPSKKSIQKSTPPAKETGFVAALKDMAAGYDQPADPKDVRQDSFVNSVKRGLNLAEQANIIGPESGKPTAANIKKVSELQRESQSLPGSESYNKFTQSKTFGEAAKNFVKNPAKIITELTGESISAMVKYGGEKILLGSLKGGALGGAAGSVIPGIGTAAGVVGGASSGATVGMAETSLGLEYTGAFIESLQKAGVDVADPASLTSAFEDDAIISEAREHALKKGIPIALFDLISGGIAGKIVTKPAKSLIGKIGAGAAEFVVQAAFDATGEAAGQVVSGEDIQPGAIMSEAIGGAGTTPVEVGLGVARIKSPAAVVAQEEQKINKSDPASLDAAGENVEQALNQKQDAIPIESSSLSVVQPASGDSQTLAEGTPKTESEGVTREENQSETQKIVDEQQGVQPQSNTEGLLESSEGTEQETGSNTGQPITDRPVSVEESQPAGEGIEQQRPSTEDTSTQITAPSAPESQPSAPPEQPKASDEVSGKPYAIAKRILDSDASEDIKRGVKQKGAEYIPKKLEITDSEAKNLIELYGEDKSEALIRDTKNDLTGDTRTALAARLYENYKAKADESSSPTEKQQYYDRAVDIALTSAEQLKEAGRQANAAKIWKAITSSEDMTVLAIEKENQRHGQNALSTIYKQVRRSRLQFDEEIQRVISKRVQEGVETQLKRAKLITAEQRKTISNTFDALKVKDVGGTANDITRVLGASVWNGSIEAVKRAVLAGADLANAIQAGVDYIRQNHKGDWDEAQYKSAISPAVEQMIPKEKVESRQIDQQQIDTPKLSGKKKKEFIDQVVEAYNQGKLTDDRFDQLYAKQLGAREFTAEDRSAIRELAKTISEVEKFEEQVKTDFTKENIAKYKSLLEKASKANTDLQQYAQKPSNIWDTLISIMQGNLLTPLSLVTNIYSNTALQPLRFLSTGIGSIVDYSVSQLAKTGMLNSIYKDKTIDLVELQKGYFQGGWNGTLEGGKQIITGPKGDERSLREINNQFSPLRAIARWDDGNRTVSQKANDYVEGTIGIPAEVMFRLLNAGDKPFRRGAETARGMEIASKKGLKGKEMEKFLMFPDPESAELIQKAGDEATFQQESESSKLVQKILSWLIEGIGKTPVLGGPLKLLAKSQIPYVKTPWNIMVETLKYAAFPVTGAVGIHQIAKGNKRSGSVLVGQALVGAMIFAVAKELFSKGLLSWDEPYDQKSGKQRERRQIQYDNIPPNALNISAIQRGLLTADWQIQDDDTWIDYNKLGVVGLLFDNYSNNYFSNIKEKGQMPLESDLWVDMLTTAPRVLSQSLDQSFLKGTNTFLTALQDGGGYESEQWLISTSGALASIVYPNTISTISKSADEFIRDTRDDSFVQRLQNTYKSKFFTGDQLPPKVNLWGEKITGNPEGRNKYAYYLFDPTKFKNVDTDNFKYKLYQAWKDSKFDDDYLPSIPRREITYRKVKIPLDAQHYEKLATYIGDQRKNLVSTYINSAGFERKDKEKVIKKLKDLYEEGAERGKKRFLRDTGWNVLTPDALSKISKK